MWWSRRTAFRHRIGRTLRPGFRTSPARAFRTGAEPIVKESLMVAGGIDIYTNQQIVIESLTR